MIPFAMASFTTYLLLLSTFVIKSSASTFCIFGEDVHCYFPCRCQNGASCDPLTGRCPAGLSCEQNDPLTRDYYSIPYWNGPGCQIGNLAYNQSCGFSTDSIQHTRKAKITNGDMAREGQRLHFEEANEALVIILEKLSSVMFIDIFLMKTADESISLNEFKTLYKVSLEKQSFRNSNQEQVCRMAVHSDNVPALRKRLPSKRQRLSFVCNKTEACKFVKITALPGDFLRQITIARVVAIGHRFIEVNTDLCMNHHGDNELKWCTKCSGSKPPDCHEGCPSGHYGINCEQNCSDTCVRGTCDRTNGSCTCKAGAQGEHCLNNPALNYDLPQTKKQEETTVDYIVISTETSTGTQQLAKKPEETTVDYIITSAETSTGAQLQTKKPEKTTVDYIVTSAETQSSWVLITVIIVLLVLLIVFLAICLIVKCRRKPGAHVLRNTTVINEAGSVRYVRGPDNRNPTASLLDNAEDENTYCSIPDADVATLPRNGGLVFGQGGNNVSNEYVLQGPTLKLDSEYLRAGEVTNSNQKSENGKSGLGNSFKSSQADEVPTEEDSYLKPVDVSKQVPKPASYTKLNLEGEPGQWGVDNPEYVQPDQGSNQELLLKRRAVEHVESEQGYLVPISGITSQS